MKFARYCTCGTSMVGTIKPDDPGLMERLWDAHKVGDGHADCDQKTAAMARAKENRQLAPAGREE